MGIHCPKCSDLSCGADHVYATLLPEDRFPAHYKRKIGRGWVYVGRTGNRVEDRFESNFNRESKCFNEKWHGFGKENFRLMHEVHSCFNPVAKEPNERDAKRFKGSKATYAEYHLCKILEQAGYCVDSDARNAFQTQPNPKR